MHQVFALLVRHSDLLMNNLVCKGSRDVSATMCDVMMILVSMNTRLKTEGLFDPNEVCAHRGQTVYCATELCLSVDKLEKDSKQGRNDVSVQCLWGILTWCAVPWS